MRKQMVARVKTTHGYVSRRPSSHLADEEHASSLITHSNHRLGPRARISRRRTTSGVLPIKTFRRTARELPSRTDATASHLAYKCRITSRRHAGELTCNSRGSCGLRSDLGEDNVITSGLAPDCLRGAHVCWNEKLWS